VGPNYLQLPVNQPKGVEGVHTNQRGGQMSYSVDVAPGQNPHVNFEPSIHNGLQTAEPKPYDPPEVHGKLTQNVIERRNDYVQARARFCTMMDWERQDLILNMGMLLSECERDVQERMLWHFLLIHDEYGKGVGKYLNITAGNVKHLVPLTGQLLTDEDKKRLQRLGENGDKIDPKAWGKHTGSVTVYRARADEVLGGMLNVSIGKDEPVDVPELKHAG
jgi:catalase